MKKLIPFSLTAIAAAAMTVSAIPAQAQFYFSAPNLSSAPVTGTEPELNLNLPGATPDELRSALVWHMRAALNVAALQCDFEPSLLTVSNYNAIIAHHDKELDQSLASLSGYFYRTVGKGKTGDRAFDKYNTKVYLQYSTVNAQRDFCSTMSKIGREAIFADRSGLMQIALTRFGEMRKALIPGNEQYFNNPSYNFTASTPSFDKKCWKKDKLMESCKESWQQQIAQSR